MGKDGGAMPQLVRRPAVSRSIDKLRLDHGRNEGCGRDERCEQTSKLSKPTLAAEWSPVNRSTGTD